MDFQTVMDASLRSFGTVVPLALLSAVLALFHLGCHGYIHRIVAVERPCQYIRELLFVNLNDL